MKAHSTSRTLDRSDSELEGERAARAAALDAAKRGQVQRQLPLWEEFLRAIPNDFARSSLFTTRSKKTPRRMLRDVRLHVMGDVEMTYRGEELRQDDELVWVQVMHLARLQPLMTSVTFTPAVFMRELGWKSASKREYDRLRAHLSRLTATTIQIRSKKLGAILGVSLIRKFECLDDGPWRVFIENEMRQLYPDSYYTQILWEQRKSLPMGLSAKLHGYYASHRDPWPVSVSNLHALCASDAEVRFFKPKLLRALESLKAVGFLESYRIEQDIVHVKRAGASAARGR